MRLSVPTDVDPAQYMTHSGTIPASSASEPTGNFRLICGLSHLAADDPIVFPGRPGASHLHAFFGNTGADAISTSASLRTSGESTCQGGRLNRTSYWLPALETDAGQVVVPDFLAIYYKGNGPSVDDIRNIRPFPPGLRMIAGYDMATPAADTHFDWYCAARQIKQQTVPHCATGERVGAVVEFRECWNGVDLDSADHRSHMAYRIYDGSGHARCPAGYPIGLPQLTIGAWFSQLGDSQDWFLSSDRMPGMTQANGSTFHADWFGGWDPATESTWVSNCINGMLSCSGGELGNGNQLIAGSNYDVNATSPRMLPIPTG